MSILESIVRSKLNVVRYELSKFLTEEQIKELNDACQIVYDLTQIAVQKKSLEESKDL